MKELLIEAREEIHGLRRTNEILRAKVEMIDLFTCVLHTKPVVPVESMAEDVTWKLQREIDNLAE